jgi:hypothetical protein
MPTTMTVASTERSRLVPVRITPATLSPVSVAQSQRDVAAHAAAPVRGQDSENSSHRPNATPAKKWRRPRYPCSAQALALLTLHPVQTSAVPLLHIGTRAPNGTLMVYDRASGRRFVVYSPRFIHEFRAGHRTGLWYFRSATNVEPDPQSQGYTTARAALEALRLGQSALPMAIEALDMGMPWTNLRP